MAVLEVGELITCRGAGWPPPPPFISARMFCTKSPSPSAGAESNSEIKVLIESVLLKNGVKKLLAKKTLKGLYYTVLRAIDRLGTELVAFGAQLIGGGCHLIERGCLHDFALGPLAFGFQQGHEPEAENETGYHAESFSFKELEHGCPCYLSYKRYIEVE
jgi:hypothetical protein